MRVLFSGQLLGRALRRLSVCVRTFEVLVCKPCHFPPICSSLHSLTTFSFSTVRITSECLLKIHADFSQKAATVQTESKLGGGVRGNEGTHSQWLWLVPSAWPGHFSDSHSIVCCFFGGSPENMFILMVEFRLIFRIFKNIICRYFAYIFLVLGECLQFIFFNWYEMLY